MFPPVNGNVEGGVVDDDDDEEEEEEEEEEEKEEEEEDGCCCVALNVSMWSVIGLKNSRFLCYQVQEESFSYPKS